MPQRLGIAKVTDSRQEIHKKFEELEWKQQLRISHGRNNPTSRWVQDETPQVKVRNRYMNVQPWEKSRVHLKVAEGQCDYINASPIVLQDLRTGIDNTYVAAQVSEPHVYSSSSNNLLKNRPSGSKASRLKPFLADGLA